MPPATVALPVVVLRTCPRGPRAVVRCWRWGQLLSPRRDGPLGSLCRAGMGERKRHELEESSTTPPLLVQACKSTCLLIMFVR